MSGFLVAVVGPSGAGKDSLIARARETFQDNPTFVFPQRLVSRPPSVSENNVFAPEEAVRWLAREDGLFLSWEAHGHFYGLPRSIERHVARGSMAICNLSRAVIGHAREKLPTKVIVVTAPFAILESRLAARQRASDGLMRIRLERMGELPADCDDVVINDSTLEIAAAEFCSILRGYSQTIQDCQHETGAPNRAPA